MKNNPANWTTVQLLMGLLILLVFIGCGSGSSGGSGVDVTITPATVRLSLASSQQFSAQVTGDANTAVDWSVQEGAAGGTVTSSGLYTAPASLGSLGTYHVIATSQADPSKSATAVVTVGIIVTATPPTVTLAPGASQQFTAQVQGTGNGAVLWNIQEGAAGGTVTSSGFYTAPSTPGTYHLIATSVVDPTQSFIIVITVTSQVGGAFGTIG